MGKGGGSDMVRFNYDIKTHVASMKITSIEIGLIQVRSF